MPLVHAVSSASQVLRAVERPLADSQCTNVLKLCSSAHDCVRVQAEAGVRVGSDDDHD